MTLLSTTALAPLIVIAFIVVALLWVNSDMVSTEIQKLKTQGAVHLKNRPCWVKKYYLIPSKHKRAQTHSYNYNYCDVLIKPDLIMVIGKRDILGLKFRLNSTVFQLDPNHKNSRSITRFKKVSYTNDRLEISFTARHYEDVMTVSIRGVTEEGLALIKQSLA